MVKSHILLVPVDVIIDSREDSKNPEFRRELEEKGLRVAVSKLEAGDFYLPAPPDKRPLLIERKTVMDLAASIRDNRLWEQVRLLREAAERDGADVLIIVEGWLGVLEKYRGWRIQSVLRAIDTVILEYRVPVLNTPSKKATAAWLAAKAKSLGAVGEKRVFRMRVEKKPMSIYDRILYVAEGLAGPVLARRLLKRYGTLRRLANATVRELMEIEGIGEKRAMEIYRILNTRWRVGEED